ncbi:MAG: fumarate hydratase, partial [Eggerthellaceae bacterium]|nr:fumarate hydratase [Eggerthellaceae bacterium]
MTRHPAIVAAEMVAAAVAEAIPRLACCLPDDVRAGLDAAAKVEENPRGAAALAQLCRNADLAAAEALPVCQDTGTV